MSAAGAGDGGAASGASQADLVKAVSEIVDDHTAWGTDSSKQIVVLLDALDALSATQAPFEPLNTDAFLTKALDFITWASECGMDVGSSRTKLDIVPGKGVGIVATAEIKIGEPFLRVPGKMFMSTTTALGTELRSVVLDDPMLSGMPTAMLSLHVLLEYYRGRGLEFAKGKGKKRTSSTALPDGTSFYRAYLDMLPSRSTCLLHWGREEFRMLEPSSIFDRCVHFFRTTAKTYCHFYDAFVKGKKSQWRGIDSVFTWDAYKWATSMVMTRQNRVPVPGKPQESALSLVPYWDMINHEPGTMTASWDESMDELHCSAMLDYKDGDEIVMSYGQRNNSLLLQYGGFVVPGNENDIYPLQIVVDPSDEYRRIRLLVLRNSAIRSMSSHGPSADEPGMFAHVIGADGVPGPELLSLLRVMYLTKPELDTLLRRGQVFGVTKVSDENDQLLATHYASLAEMAASRLASSRAGSTVKPPVSGLDAEELPAEDGASGGAGGVPSTESAPAVVAAAYTGDVEGVADPGAVLGTSAYWIGKYLDCEEAILRRAVEWGRAVSKGEKEIDDTGILEFREELGAQMAEMMAAQAAGGGGHGHSHGGVPCGGHGHSHGGAGGHGHSHGGAGGHGHSHGGAGGHGHSHGGGGHGHSHGGGGHGHSHGGGGHGHSHGGVPCGGHGHSHGGAEATAGEDASDAPALPPSADTMM